MEASSVLMSSSSSSPTYVLSNSRKNPFFFIPKTLSARFPCGHSFSFPKCERDGLLFSCPRSSIPTITQVVENSTLDSAIESSNCSNVLPKIDKSGRFCSPRAARELALMILYAACLEGSDPVRLFEKRMNIRREVGYEFDRACLMEYDHMSFGGPPVTTETVEEADEILQIDQKQSEIEAEVLSAPPKLVYSKLILRFTRKLLVAVAENWDSNVLAIDKAAPPNWKEILALFLSGIEFLNHQMPEIAMMNGAAGRILEFSILHLAMSEIAVLGTRHQIVINEAVDLAKRFCDGAAPRIINGCLRTYIREASGNGEARNVKVKETV